MSTTITRAVGSSICEYVLGYSDSEHDRLIRQARLIAPITERFFREAGIGEGQRVVDLGSGGGFDCFVAAQQVGAEGRVVGVDMTEEMLSRSRAAAATMGLSNVEFRRGVIEALPIENGWADVVISNGVINSAPTSARSSPRLCGC